LRSEVFDVFQGVDRILHAGDIGPADLLVELEALAPVVAVYGNTDGFEIRGRCPKVAELELEGLLTVITHGDEFGSPTPKILLEAFPHAEIIVYGHTHEPALDLLNRTVTVMNPGVAGRGTRGSVPSVGIMELEAGLPPRARLVPLHPGSDKESHVAQEAGEQ
jgi:putative phosphoesterase